MQRTTSSCLDRLADHLFLHQLIGQSPAFHLEQRLGIEPSEQVEEQGNQPGPARLMAGAEPRAVVAVEVLVEQDQIAPVRVFLESG